MPGTVQGREVAVIVCEEGTYNDATGITTGEKVYFRTMGGGGSRALETDDTLSGLRGAVKPIAGAQDVSFPIAMNVAPEDSLGILLKNLIGVPTTVGVDPYTHTFDLTGAVAPSLLFERDYGSRVTAAKKFSQNRGCRVNDMRFELSASGFLTATANILGASTVRNLAVSLDATPDDFGHAAFSMFNATIKKDGAVVAEVKSFSLNISADLDGDTHTIGGGGARGSLDQGLFMISGTVDALFQDVIWIEDAENETSVQWDLEIVRGTGDGSAGNESLIFSIPASLFSVKDPEISGPKGMRVNLDMQGHRVGAAEDAFSVELKNTRATY